MLAELFDRLVDHAKAALKPQAMSIGAEPPHRYLLAAADGTHTMCEAQPHPRAHQPFSLDSLVEFVRIFAGDDAVVWHSRRGVVALLDDGTRRDRLNLALKPSSQLSLLLDYDKQAPFFPQKQFIKLLRVNFDGCLSNHPNLIPSLRTVKLDLAQQGEADIQQNKVSLGKTIVNQLHGAGAIPDTVELLVPVFENLSLPRQAVRCAIEIDIPQAAFQLTPFPGAVEEAVQRAESIIGTKLADGLADAASVFYGQP